VDYRVGRREWVPALRQGDLTVAAGEFVAIVGESGSGKTTLVQAALGLLPANARVRSGRIAFSGVDTTRWRDDRMARVRGNYVGFIPQDPNTSLNPTKRIGRQVAEAVLFNDAARLSAPTRREAALEALRQAGLDRPERVFDQYPHELSGGMKQRVLIAIALAGGPKLILADEPTSALDVTVQKVILDHLERLREALGIGLALVTHDLAVALDRSDRIVVMKDGRVVEQGGRDLILERAASGYTRQLLAATPAWHAGRLRPTLAGTAPRTAGALPPAIRALGLVKRYPLRGKAGGEVRALDGVDFTVQAGAVHAIVGESGAGKSTLAAALVGFTAPDEGLIEIEGRPISGLRRRELREVRRHLQYVFQNPNTSLDPRFTVARLVAEPLQAFGLVKDRARLRDRVRESLHSVALDDSYLDRTPAQLSGGQRQRVAIARALALRPRVIVLDEPVSALDVSVQAQILQLLVDLRAELGLTYVFVSHDIGVVKLLSDQITVMKDGLVVEEGPAQRVLAAPSHSYTRELLDAVPGRHLAKGPGPKADERKDQ
jgi:peptide/nickel transport system ATP-binding protein